MAVVFSDGYECLDFKVDGFSPSTDCQIQCGKDEGSGERIKELDEENDELSRKCHEACDDLEGADTELANVILENPSLVALQEVRSAIISAKELVDL